MSVLAGRFPFKGSGSHLQDNILEGTVGDWDCISVLFIRCVQLYPIRVSFDVGWE